ncbi:di-heme oxidoredictase family protein [Gymnodinialimonas sp. 2305UL16-5]|uniref:di-heme oxidoreductase family protein n=1 Tax=Gymnodinialimonas mytili TaxID=3126503 RepID=UPI0030A66E10
MRYLPLAFLPICVAFAIPALIQAQSEVAPDWSHLGDPHLQIVPRSEAERARVAGVTAPPADFSQALAFEENGGGAGTVRARMNADAFSQPMANLAFEEELDFRVGNGLFRRLWVSPPASTIASDGLGPLFNARSCQRCHIKDGRGHPPEGPDDNAVSMLMRVTIPGGPLSEIEGYLATQPDPVYGGQLQDRSLAGHPSEFRMQIEYEEIEVPLSGGAVATLRQPTYTMADLGYGPLHPDVMFSPRVAPQMIGLGLLEAIPAQDILAGADPLDADGDGISGRPQVVWSVEFDQPMLGRFGHKAGMPTLRAQNAGAFSGDIGISSPLNPALWGDCTEAQAACRTAIHGDNPEQNGFEIDEIGLDLVTFYTAHLAVPARRDVDAPEVLRGREVFHATGCAGCHTPSFVTHRQEGDPATSFQLIWPYSDLLLHDMGDGLADHSPEGRATGREWRTAPLWGIGMTETVSGHTYFLHDGRARSLLEAVLWHGGEAQSARDAVVEMPPEDRAALIAFLESL